jgi:hypothetical protein
MRFLTLSFVTSMVWLTGCGDNSQPLERDGSELSTVITINDAISTTSALQVVVTTSQIKDNTVAGSTSKAIDSNDSAEKTITTATTTTTAATVTTTTSTTVVDEEPYDYIPMETYEPSSGSGSELVTYEPSG